MKRSTWTLGLFLAAVIITAIDCPGQQTQSADDKNVVLPWRHLSESQVVDIAFRAFPQSSALQCQFKDGVWNIFDVKKDQWGVASTTTNADGHITVTSTNVMQLVLKVNDADGKAEPVKTP